ncbi:hypothetical protein ACTFIV_010237 [Dictyostelium citrinum]
MEILKFQPNSCGVLNIYEKDLIENHILVAGESIPNTCTDLILRDGFNLELTKDIIPNSVIRLTIFNVLKPLTIESIPKSVKVLYLNNGFNQIIDKKGILPDTINELLLYEIGNEIPMEFLPLNLETIKYCYDYPFEIKKQQIPSTVKSLVLDKIQYNLTKHSIPSTVENLTLTNFFHHEIDVDVLPSTLKRITLFGIKSPINVNVLPEGLNEISLFDYDYDIPLNWIPSTVKIVTIRKKGINFIEGMIPPSVSTLNLPKSYSNTLNRKAFHSKTKIIFSPF